MEEKQDSTSGAGRGRQAISVSLNISFSPKWHANAGKFQGLKDRSEKTHEGIPFLSLYYAHKIQRHNLPSTHR